MKREREREIFHRKKVRIKCRIKGKNNDIQLSVLANLNTRHFHEVGGGVQSCLGREKTMVGHSFRKVDFGPQDGDTLMGSIRGPKEGVSMVAFWG